MKKIINLKINLLAIALFFSAMACQDELPSPQDAKVSVAYIDELQNTDAVRFSVKDNGGSTSFTPRISNLSKGSAFLKVETPQEVLDAYNKKNNSKYQMLPANAFNLINTKTGEKGKSLTLHLDKNDFGGNIKVEVGEMVDAQGKKLPVSTQYAIPIALTEASSDGYVNTQIAKTGLLLLDREFKSSVLRAKRAGAHRDIRIRLKDVSKAVDYENWTAQFSVRFAQMNESAGLVWPNASKGGNLYQIMYGARLTLFTTAGGKVGYNQPEFDSFKFETNKWYHFAIVFEMINNIPYFKQYVNGKLAYSGPWTGKIDWSTGFAFASTTFDGYMRELRFWDRALSLSEINSTTYFADPSAEGLVIYMPLNEETQFENVATKTKGNYEVIFTGDKDLLSFDNEFIFP